MAKKRKRTDAVPKKIAGMKVPKALRRGRVGRLLASPVGQALIVETVARAGEHLVGRESRTGSTARKTAARSREAISDFAEGATEGSAAFVHALRQAARAFVASMQEQQVAARAEGVRNREPPMAGRGEDRLEKKDQGERPDRRTAH